MCFSAEASFTAAIILLPAGALTLRWAYKSDTRYLPIAALPLLFGLQQLLEGSVWIAGAYSSSYWIERASLAYMFFSWLAWPVWVPVSAYFLESERRKPLFLCFVVAGAMLGSIQYIPYFAHDGWLTTHFLPHAIRYEGIELLDYIATREVTYTIYVAVVVGPLLMSAVGKIKIFGVLVLAVLVITYFFFSYAYISVFCFGGALMSLYLVWVIFRNFRKPGLIARPSAPTLSGVLDKA